MAAVTLNRGFTWCSSMLSSTAKSVDLRLIASLERCLCSFLYYTESCYKKDRQKAQKPKHQIRPYALKTPKKINIRYYRYRLLSMSLSLTSTQKAGQGVPLSPLPHTP
jgi:hypothetical protein